jgi:pSer/pThr/pTyr-binding forkhead associated (FHA) protein
MPARLIVTRGPETGSQFPLRKRIVTIGRDDGCAIHLDREGVSRNHAQLSLEQGAWSITDLKSRNGTLVNGSRIVEHALTSGDVIGIHDIRLRFEVSDAPPPKAAAGPRELGREDVELVERLRKGREAILGEVRKVIIGQEEVVEQLIIALFCRGHGLIVGVPGLAKTLLVRARSPASRPGVQAHPVHAGPHAVGHHGHGGDRGGPSTRERFFKFLRGPIFTNVLLADEINRTPPKTQAALLEAMQERRVTAGGETHELKLRSSCWPRRTRSSRRAPTRCRRRSSTASCSSILVSYPSGRRRWTIVQG